MKRLIYSIIFMGIISACSKKDQNDSSKDNIKIDDSAKSEQSEQIFASIDSFMDLSLQKIDSSSAQPMGSSFVLIEKSKFKNADDFAESEVEGYYLLKFDASKFTIEKDEADQKVTAELKLGSVFQEMWSSLTGKGAKVDSESVKMEKILSQRVAKARGIKGGVMEDTFAEKQVFGMTIKEEIKDGSRIAASDNGRLSGEAAKLPAIKASGGGSVTFHGMESLNDVPAHLRPYISQDAGHTLLASIDAGGIRLPLKSFTFSEKTQELTIVMTAEKFSTQTMEKSKAYTPREVAITIKTNPVTHRTSESWDVVITPIVSTIKLNLVESNNNETTQNIKVISSISGGESTLLAFEACKDLFSPPNYGTFLLAPAVISSETEVKAWLIDTETKEVKAQTTIPVGQYAVGQYIRTKQ